MPVKNGQKVQYAQDPAIAARNDEIKDLWDEGKLTAREIGERYGVTGARVSQIIANPHSHLVKS